MWSVSPDMFGCRDCHITKKVQAPEEAREQEEEQEGPEEVTTEICEIVEG